MAIGRSWMPKTHKSFKIVKSSKLRFRFKIFALTGLILAFLVIAAYFSYDPASNFYGNVFKSIITKDKVIALTFDDGPNGETTLKVLDILKQEDVKATFFVVGDNVKFYPAIAKKIATDGNEIENHSTHHAHSLQFETEYAIYKDLTETNQIIYAHTGQMPRFYRPPFGFRSPWAFGAARAAKLITVTWNDLTQDYSAKSDSVIVSYIEKFARPGGVIVLHDGSGAKHGVDHPNMLKALPQIIENLKAKGYKFVTVSELYDRSYAK
ncbi:MAG: polysaccharide deacetylase [Candidatus Doudnabacteria bacterium]|nr:polysaccharide deacetylase [Candidatus Doudnabacteria bacterium]